MSYRKKHIHPKIRSLRPKKRFWKKRWFWTSFLLAALAAGLFYLFFFFPKFQVQTVTVWGNDKVSGEDISSVAWKAINKKMLGIRQRNIFTVYEDSLKQSLLDAFPAIEEVAVKKEWLGAVNLKITERKPLAVFCQGSGKENCFTLDKHGVIYESAYSIAGNLIVRAGSGFEAPLSEGQHVIDASLMQSIVKIRDTLRHNFQIELAEVLWENPLVATTTEGWKIYFDPAVNMEMQITKMDLLLKNEITPAVRKKLNYIYLQYKDRAYYK